MFRKMQKLYETEQIVSGDGDFLLVIPNKTPNRRHYIYINRILLGSAGLNIRIADPSNSTIDKFDEKYWTENVFTIDKHFVNEVVVVSQSDNVGNVVIGVIEYSERTDSADITPKSFFITIYGEIRE